MHHWCCKLHGRQKFSNYVYLQSLPLGFRSSRIQICSGKLAGYNYVGLVIILASIIISRMSYSYVPNCEAIQYNLIAAEKLLYAVLTFAQ